MTRRRLLIALALAVVLLIPTVEQRGSSRPPRPYAVPCISSHVPSGCIFGLSAVQYVVQSAYAYEWNLIPSHAPVGDYDYVLPDGWQEWVRLPGGSWDAYRYEGALYVLGSGWISEWCHLGGGCFSFEHLDLLSVGSLPTPRTPPAPPTVRRHDGLSGDERTALAALNTPPQGPPGAIGSIYRGGTIVGRSRWPDWSMYAGGGYPGPSDAHLCLLLDGAALTWFWLVATGQDHAPKPRPVFPRKRWGRYPASSHGRLIWPAAWTWRHGLTRLYPYTDHARWYGRMAGRRYGYDVYHFGARGVLRCWPHYGTCKASRR